MSGCGGNFVPRWLLGTDNYQFCIRSKNLVYTDVRNYNAVSLIFQGQLNDVIGCYVSLYINPNVVTTTMT